MAEIKKRRSKRAALNQNGLIYTGSKMKDLDWNNLGFSYIKTDYRFIAHWKDGKWDEGKLTTDNMLHIHEGSTAIHYG